MMEDELLKKIFLNTRVKRERNNLTKYLPNESEKVDRLVIIRRDQQIYWQRALYYSPKI